MHSSDSDVEVEAVYSIHLQASRRTNVKVRSTTMAGCTRFQAFFQASVNSLQRTRVNRRFLLLYSNLAWQLGTTLKFSATEDGQET